MQAPPCCVRELGLRALSGKGESIQKCNKNMKIKNKRTPQTPQEAMARLRNIVCTSCGKSKLSGPCVVFKDKEHFHQCTRCGFVHLDRIHSEHLGLPLCDAQSSDSCSTKQARTPSFEGDKTRNDSEILTAAAWQVSSCGASSPKASRKASRADDKHLARRHDSTLTNMCEHGRCQSPSSHV